MVKSFILALSVVIASMLGGCGLVVMQTAKTIRGGTSDTLMIEKIPSLENYASLNFEPFVSDIGSNIPQELLQYLNEKTEKELRDEGFKQSSGNVLIVSGKVIDINDGALDDRISVRAGFKDAASGQVLGVVNITGNGSGLNAAARGLASGLTDILTKHGMH